MEIHENNLQARFGVLNTLRGCILKTNLFLAVMLLAFDLSGLSTPATPSLPVLPRPGIQGE